MPDIKERIERNSRTLEMVNSWINSADNKISISCAVFSIVYGGITLVAETVKTNAHANGEDIPLVPLVLLILGALMMATSLGFYLLAIIPKLTTLKKKDNSPSLFYGDIAASTLERFQEFEEKITHEQFNREIVVEIYINSKICFAKMEKFKIGTILSSIAILCSLVALIALTTLT